MEISKDQEECLKIIMEEYKRLSNGINLLSTGILRDFQLFFGFVAALFAISFKIGSYDDFVNNYFLLLIFLLLPIIIFIFAIFFLLKLSQLIINATAIRFIEHRINIFFRRTLLIWESFVSANLVTTWKSSYFIMSIIFGFILFIGYVSPIIYLNYYNILPIFFIAPYYKIINYIYGLFVVIIALLLVRIYFENKDGLAKIEKLIKENDKNIANP